jgi:organic radical activating enzyme
MKKIIKIEQQDNAPMFLTWVINNICTNACSYCPSVLHDGKNHHYNWEKAREFFKILFQRYPNIHCSVSGGEPSVSPFLPEIAKIFHEANHTLGLTSNAAKPVDYWDNISPYLNYICFSYHPEFPDKKFVEKVSTAGNHTFVTARVMMYPSMWDHCVEMYNQLKELSHIFVEPVRILDWGGLDKFAFKYTDEQLQFFIDNARIPRILGHLTHVKSPIITPTFYLDDGTIDSKPNTVDYINAGMTNFSGYSCEIGLKALFINYNGDVFLGNCLINGAIGNINSPENIRWPDAPVICNKDLCHCTSDVNINKRML